MTMIIGFMVSTAWINTSRAEQRWGKIKDLGIAPDLAVDAVKMAERLKALGAEVAKLRDENAKVQNAYANKDSASKELTSQLNDARRIACQSEVVGPGVQVTLRDSKRTGAGPEIDAAIIHDVDLLRIVNELWNAGAEAVAIDDRRIGPGTNIRCVGSTVLIDQEKVAAPVTVRAIGGQKNLIGALELPGGIIAELRSVDSSMVKIEAQNIMTLPPWTSPTIWKYAKEPAERQQ